MSDECEAELCDILYDAFMAFWRAVESEQDVLWSAYLTAEARYEAYLRGKE